MTDRELIETYARSRSQEAFAQIVQRHAGWVCAAARRQVRDPHLAEDITQAVFLLLGQKAADVARHDHLSGWLFRTTRYCCANALREQNRRHQREQELAMSPTQSTPAGSTDWDQIQPHLETAVANLRESDRQAVLLRFYEGHSLQQVAAALGLGEEAAKKRVQRALEKLRAALARQGITAGSVSLGAVLLTNLPTSTPSDLALTLTSAIHADGTSPSQLIAKGVVKTMFWTKVKVAAAVLLGVAIAGGVSVVAATKGPATTQAAAASQPTSHRQVFVPSKDSGGASWTKLEIGVPQDHPKLYMAQARSPVGGRFPVQDKNGKELFTVEVLQGDDEQLEVEISKGDYLEDVELKRDQEAEVTIEGSAYKLLYPSTTVGADAPLTTSKATILIVKPLP